jgi:hypothetical protein
VSIIKKMRKQKAIWWRRAGQDHHGNPFFAEPVEVDCRWEEVSQEYLGPQGIRQLSNAVVYVDRPMENGDRLALAELDSSTAFDPEDSGVESFQIERFDALPNLKATEFLYTAFL